MLPIMLLAALGCGKRGAPLPPLPRGPLAARVVSARQIGDVVEVRATMPGTRAGRPGQEPTRAELLRVEFPPQSAPALDPASFARRGTVVGSSDIAGLAAGTRLRLLDDTVAALRDRGVGWTLRYGVRLHDARGRSSALALAADLVPLAVVSGPAAVRGTPAADGVRLTWDVDDHERTFNVYRSAVGAPVPERPLNAAPLRGGEYLDGTVRLGETYFYEVRPVLGAPPPWREGRAARSASVTARDTFPPVAPTGLVAVQEGPAVRLFWNPNAERDLAGYRVERRAPSGDWSVRVPLVSEPRVLDDVAPGEVWIYRVIALDRADPPNASTPSATAEIVVAADPSAEPRTP